MNNTVKILVVEGSRTQAELLKLVLQGRGYQVLVTTNGEEAIAVARQHRPALILSGVAMAGIDGYGMCAALKQDAALKDIPVVLLTALSDAEDLMHGLAAKVDYCIAKPYQEDELLARIAAILARQVRHGGKPGQEQLTVSLRDKLHVITSDRQQLLCLLLSMYENYGAMLQQNHVLSTAQMQLKARNQHLEEERKKDHATPAPAKEAAPHGKAVTVGATGLRILVAEDSVVNQIQLVRLLEKLGYQADVAANGRAAVEACATTAYAAVLMDVQMPILGGFAATASIRKQNEAAGIHTPIIAVTAHTQAGDRERCLMAGMDDYLPKPVKPDVLKAALSRWLTRSAPLSSPRVEAVQ